MTDEHTTPIFKPPEKPDEEQLAKLFIDGINNMAFDDRLFGQHLANCHATLQQSAMRAFLAFAQAMAAKPYVDLRNEGSAKFAKEIIKIDSRLPFI